MKVVLFCGGQGLRLRDFSINTPKPMVEVGSRPILWNIMKYYAHFGHKDFILLLGHKGDVIKNYFINYSEYLTNDFVLSKGGSTKQLLNSDIADWTITFIDTGIGTSVGERLWAVRDFLKNEEFFLANYADGLTDLPLNKMIEKFKNSDHVGSLMACQPQQSFHLVSFDAKEDVNHISPLAQSGLWINAGYFIFRKTIFDYLGPGEELVEEPFRRLIEEKKLFAYKYKGFWQSMDTFKDKQKIDDMYLAGDVPWEVWKADKVKKNNHGDNKFIESEHFTPRSS